MEAGEIQHMRLLSFGKQKVTEEGDKRSFAGATNQSYDPFFLILH